jgi:hypothetical protein
MSFATRREPDVSSNQISLFGDGCDEEPLEQPLQQAVKRARSSTGYQLAPHACRFCFGRVLQRVARGQVVEVRCAECGAHALGAARDICCCGADCGDMGFVLECVRNPNVSKENPHEILVRERRTKRREEVAAPVVRPVNVRDY